MEQRRLDGDFAPKPRVAGPVDLTHPPGAERRNHLVRSKARTGGEGHRPASPGRRNGRGVSPGASTLVPAARQGRVTEGSLFLISVQPVRFDEILRRAHGPLVPKQDLAPGDSWNLAAAASGRNAAASVRR